MCVCFVWTLVDERGKKGRGVYVRVCVCGITKNELLTIDKGEVVRGGRGKRSAEIN